MPAECGMVEAGVATAHEWIGLIRRRTGFSASIQTAEAAAAVTPAGPFSGEPSENAQRKLHHRISVQTNSTPAQIR